MKTKKVVKVKASRGSRRGDPASKTRGEQDVRKRWTPKLVKGGWTPVSDFFLENYHRLRPPLTTSEAMLVIHLLKHKWDERPPFPAYKTLAKRMGISITAVRNHARKLDEGKHYVKRMRQYAKPNKFDLTPLFDALEKLRAEQRAARKAATGAAEQASQ